ncbi:MAG: YggU family protein [Chloroflexi bacterium HGW-Chloroflexi-4]|jgi:hypothetical protein|nr:MAG: YggU family protein [Chloroflexi bacterium HGW-Chloroflexi-4]
MSGEHEKSIIKIKLIPRSSRNEVVGLMADGTIKIKLTAPPVEGKANLSLIKFLADKLKTSPTSIEIISGKTSHSKLISIDGINQNTINSLLL